jgi:hypothetical protein
MVNEDHVIHEARTEVQICQRTDFSDVPVRHACPDCGHTPFVHTIPLKDTTDRFKPPIETFSNKTVDDECALCRMEVMRHELFQVRITSW